jgi:predicted histone-like DNA-binding protein
MAVFYRLQQDNRCNAQHRGYWYPKTVNLGTVGTDELATLIQRNCSVKRSDVKAVLTELAEVMQDKLQASHRVRLDGIGSFKIGFSSRGAESPETFSAKKHVKSLHIIFTPELQRDDNGRHTKALLNGTTVQEMR